MLYRLYSRLFFECQADNPFLFPPSEFFIKSSRVSRGASLSKVYVSSLSVVDTDAPSEAGEAGRRRGVLSSDSSSSSTE